ncbi:MAG: PDZ domain-containing protein [Woeseia sp.]
MSGLRKNFLLVFVAVIGTPAFAQDAGTAADVEARERAIEKRVQAGEVMAARREREGEAIEVQMREAEERLAEAAARVAELSRSKLPQIARAGRFMSSNHAVLGITLGSDNSGSPVEGAAITAVTPGSAAAEAGLRAGDVITAVNDENLSAESPETANRKLIDFMAGVEEGDTLDIKYLRDGRAATVEVTPRSVPGYALAFRNGGFRMPGAPPAPSPGRAPSAPDFFHFFGGSGSWSDMELVSLTEDLGRYFGTDKGLLIVRAPKDDSLKLRDGDVISSIDGRVPSSVTHAMRILGSYQSGETLEIEIMRDKRRQTVTVEMPDNRQSAVGELSFSPAPSIGVKVNVAP